MAKESEESERGESNPSEETDESSGGSDSDVELNIPEPDLPSPSDSGSSSLGPNEESGATRLGSDESDDDEDDEAPVPPPTPTDVESGSATEDSDFKETPETGDVDPISDDGRLPTPERDEGERSAPGREDDTSDGSEPERPPPSADDLLDKDAEFPEEDTVPERESGEPSGSGGSAQAEPDGESGSDDVAGEDPTDILQKSELRDALEEQESSAEASLPEDESDADHPPSDEPPEDPLDPSASPAPPDRGAGAAAEDFQLDPGSERNASSDLSKQDEISTTAPTPKGLDSASPEIGSEPTSPSESGGDDDPLAAMEARDDSSEESVETPAVGNEAAPVDASAEEQVPDRDRDREKPPADAPSDEGTDPFAVESTEITDEGAAPTAGSTSDPSPSGTSRTNGAADEAAPQSEHASEPADRRDSATGDGRTGDGADRPAENRNAGVDAPDTEVDSGVSPSAETTELGSTDEPRQPPVATDDLETGFAAPEGLMPQSWGSRIALIAAVAFVLLLTAVAIASAVVTNMDGDRLRRTLRSAEQARSSDTYSAWRGAFETAAVASHDVAEPGTLRSTIHWIGGLVGVDSPRDLRRRIRGRRAYYAAVLEYRYEHSGARRAASRAEGVFSGDSSSGLARAAATYRLLARDHDARALEKLREVEPGSAEPAALADAKLAAALAADDGAAARNTAEAIVGSEASRYRRYLVARASRFRDGQSEADELRTFLQETGSDHLDARIARIDALRRKGKLDSALELATDIRQKHLGSASTYQRARLLLALGRIRSEQNGSSEAREHFLAAIRAAPKRASLYEPLVGLLVDRVELDAAANRLERARSMAGDAPVLQRADARIAFLKGEFERTLEILEKGEYRDRTTDELRARALLQLDRPDQALEFLDALDGPSGESAVLQILRLDARYRTGDLEPDAATKRMEEIISNGSEDPLVLRTAARLHLDRAEKSVGENHETHVDRAVKLLETEAPTPAEQAQNDYLLCRVHILGKDAEQAERTCKSGRDTNPKFLPGMYTLARLQVLRGRTDEARLLLDGLDRGGPPRWQSVELRVRAALRDEDPSTAREALDRWDSAGENDRPESKLLRALVAFHEGNYRRTLERLDGLEAPLGESPEARLYRAHAMTRADRQHEKAGEMLGALNDHPWWSPYAWLAFGELRRRQVRTRDALENLRFAEQKFDEEFTPTSQLEHLYIERARVWRLTYDWDFRKVASNLEEARQISEDSSSPELHLVLGEYALGRRNTQPKEAVEHFQATLKAQPHRCEAARGLARAFRELFDDESKAKEKVDQIEALSSGRCSE